MAQLDLSDNYIAEAKEITTPSEQPKSHGRLAGSIKEPTNTLVSCLRNEKIIVKFLPKDGGLVTDKKHILYGGLGESSKRRYTVPRTSTGVFVNVLTNSEKAFLEDLMGLPHNAMSVYLKTDNFWENKYVTLGKDNSVLDLSNPEDYIKYKILKVNTDFIAPSEESLKTLRKATYQYVLMKEGEEVSTSINSLNIASSAYMKFGELKSDVEKLALIVEIATGKVVSKLDPNTVLSQVGTLIQNNPKAFITAAEDEYLDTKLLLKKSIAKGLVRKKGQYYYFTEDNSPICNEGQEPILQVACAYLNAPKHQEKMFALQAKLKQD